MISSCSKLLQFLGTFNNEFFKRDPSFVWDKVGPMIVDFCLCTHFYVIIGFISTFTKYFIKVTQD